MDKVEEHKNHVIIPTQHPSSGNSEEDSGFEKETAILVQPEKPKDSNAESGHKEGGGYASYAVSQSNGAQSAAPLYEEELTDCV